MKLYIALDSYEEWKAWGYIHFKSQLYPQNIDVKQEQQIWKNNIHQEPYSPRE